MSCRHDNCNNSLVTGHRLTWTKWLRSSTWLTSSSLPLRPRRAKAVLHLLRFSFNVADVLALHFSGDVTPVLVKFELFCIVEFVVEKTCFRETVRAGWRSPGPIPAWWTALAFEGTSSPVKVNPLRMICSLKTILPEYAVGMLEFYFILSVAEILSEAAIVCPQNLLVTPFISRHIAEMRQPLWRGSLFERPSCRLLAPGPTLSSEYFASGVSTLFSLLNLTVHPWAGKICLWVSPAPEMTMNSDVAPQT